MSFTLTPPLLVRNQTAFAILQPNNEDPPEPLVITMAGWSPFDLFSHWRREIEMLLNGTRNRCCVVSGLTIIDAVTRPSEWWTVYLRDHEARLRYQVLRVNSSNEWLDPSCWWKNISPPTVAKPPVSEWHASRGDLFKWCTQCDVLIAAISATETDCKSEEENEKSQS